MAAMRRSRLNCRVSDDSGRNGRPPLRGSRPHSDTHYYDNDKDDDDDGDITMLCEQFIIVVIRVT